MAEEFLRSNNISSCTTPYCSRFLFGSVISCPLCKKVCSAIGIPVWIFLKEKKNNYSNDNNNNILPIFLPNKYRYNITITVLERKLFSLRTSDSVSALIFSNSICESTSKLWTWPVSVVIVILIFFFSSQESEQ